MRSAPPYAATASGEENTLRMMVFACMYSVLDARNTKSGHDCRSSFKALASDQVVAGTSRRTRSVNHPHDAIANNACNASTFHPSLGSCTNTNTPSAARTFPAVSVNTAPRICSRP